MAFFFGVANSPSIIRVCNLLLPDSAPEPPSVVLFSWCFAVVAFFTAITGSEVSFLAKWEAISGSPSDLWRKLRVPSIVVPSDASSLTAAMVIGCSVSHEQNMSAMLIGGWGFHSIVAVAAPVQRDVFRSSDRPSRCIPSSSPLMQVGIVIEERILY